MASPTRSPPGFARERPGAGEERKGARSDVVEASCDLERQELRGILDEEIGRLPEKYRRPVVLCYLEGQTHEQAARRLRCTEGVVRGRLDRARQRLKTRLTRRGVVPSTGLIASSLAGDMASAAVPPSWIAATVATLGRAATARAISTTVSASALELANGVFRAMILAKLKVAASFVAAGNDHPGRGRGGADELLPLARPGSERGDRREASRCPPDGSGARP